MEKMNIAELAFASGYLADIRMLSNTEFFKRGFKLELTIATQSFLD